MTTLISTTGQPAGEQADYWSHVVSAVFGSLQVLPPHRDGFPGEILGRTLGPVQASEVRGPPHVVRRTARHVARDSRECYKITLVLRGSCVLRQAGRQVMATPGDLVMYDLTRPVEVVFETHRVFTLVIPHPAIPLPDARVAELTGTLLTGRAHTARLMTSLLATLADDDEAAEGPHAHHLGEAIVDLAAGVMSERAGVEPHPSGVHIELQRCVEDWVEHHLADPDLSPATIAAVHHVSVRQLYRVFQAKGTTVARYVRTRRLERCRRELCDPLFATQRVSAIASRWGFPDAAAFSRAFRAAYGVSPREYRTAATGTTRD